MAITVDDLYSLVLNREADPGGRDFWANYIKQGPTRGVDPEELDAFIAGARSAGENVSSTGTQRVLGLLTGAAQEPVVEPATQQEAAAVPSRYTNIETVKAPTADVDQSQEPDKYFATDSQTGERVELLKASEYPVGRGPAGTEWLARRAGDMVTTNDGRFLPFEALDSNGNIIGTWNMQKNELSDFAKTVGGATKIAAILGTGYAVGSAAGLFDPSLIGTESFITPTTVTPTGGALAAPGVVEGATASFAPGSLQSTLSQLGVTVPSGASVVPESLGAFLTELGVTPFVQGGVSAGVAGLTTPNPVTNGITNAVTNAITNPNVTPSVNNLLNSLAGGADKFLSSASPLLSALASNEATKDVINTLQSQGLSAQQAYRALAEEASRDVSFTPYGVSTSLFSTTRPTTTGQFDSSLSADGKSLFDAATAAAQGSFTEAGTADLNQMAADRMALYQQLVSPEQQRSRLAQEARLQAQGRLGVGAGGGEYAPELKALEDAIAKQNLQFALAAPQEALAQRTALINQGVSAAQVPTAISQQQLTGLQLGGQLGQQQAQTAYQRGGLLGQYTGQGISENLLAQLAAAQVQTEQNKALATAIGGLGNRSGSSDGGLFSNLLRTGTDLYNIGRSIIG